MKKLVLAALLSIAPAAALAQDPSIGQGTRVKLRTSTIKAAVGAVTSATADSVSLLDDRGGRISVARKEITQLYISSGRTAGAGAKKGAAWGAAFGVVGAASMLTDPCAGAPDKNLCKDSHKSDNKGALAVSMFAATTLGGVMAGLVIKAEEWMEVSSQSHFAFKPYGRGLALSMSFR